MKNITFDYDINSNSSDIKWNLIPNSVSNTSNYFVVPSTDTGTSTTFPFQNYNEKFFPGDLIKHSGHLGVGVVLREFECVSNFYSFYNEKIVVAMFSNNKIVAVFVSEIEKID